MAITTNTFKVNAGWASSDVITQMEQAMVSLGWAQGEITGYIVGLGSITGGGDTNALDYYEDVRPKSTTGIGTGASFYVTRDANCVQNVWINRPGLGYTSGEIVTLSADDIGGFANGAEDLSFPVCVDEIVGNGTTISIAVTTQTYQGNGNAGNTYVWEFDIHTPDRAGAVGAGLSIVTVREGDTISIANSYSSTYDPVVTLPHFYTADSTGWDVIAGWDLNINPGDGYSQYTFKVGQAGTYYWKSQGNGLGPEMGRLVVLPWSGDPGDRTIVGYGTTAAFWDKDLVGSGRPYGVQKHQIEANKLYGNTFRCFRQDNSAGNLDILSFNDYMHYDGNEYYPNVDNGQTAAQFKHGGTGYRKRVCGASNLDFQTDNIGGATNQNLSFSEADSTHDYNKLALVTYGTNYGFDLDLNLFRSSIDPRFVVFSYRYPTLSSTHLTTNTFDTFFFHNFESTLWDYDHVFLSGMTKIIPTTGNTIYPDITFRTHLNTSYNTSAGNGQKRAAEFPWNGYISYASNDENYVDTTYQSMSYRQDMTTYHARIYYRSEDQPKTFRGGYPYQTEDNGTSRVSPEANFNAVIKGLPINAHLIPCPYYIPDDFGLIEFYYNAANANIQQGDTFTISPSEVWTVITASYNQTTVTRGIAFCARTV